jgi:hypothetical protein
MDSIVTARIPVEVKNQVSEILESLGSNTTKLINAAFEYVLVTGRLPDAYEGASLESSAKRSSRQLSEKDKEELSALFGKISVPAPASFWNDLGDNTYKEAISEWRSSDYEALD